MMRVIVEECPAIGDDAHCWWRPLDAHQEARIDGSKLCGEEGVHAEDERLEVGAVEFLKQRPDGLQTVMQEHPQAASTSPHVRLRIVHSQSTTAVNEEQETS